jgi:hypothetical protein
LNYAYAVLESQCRQALASRGFDLACGFLHSDKAGRDSLVYDLMECERGTVDGMVLDFLARVTFHAGDFTRVTDGSCRLHPQLARAVVAACRVGQSRLDDHVRWLRASLLAAALSPDRERVRGAGAQTPASPTSVQRRPLGAWQLPER